MTISEKKSVKTIVKTDIPSSEAGQTDPSRDISIWLDTYDDLFSDFDPRPFSERNFSDDFINELKKLSWENDSQVNELRLLLPEKNRDQEQESIISRRIHSFFRKNVHSYEQQVQDQKKRSILFVVIAVAIMLAASYISLLKSENILKHTLLVILEPAGWFLMWTGLDALVTSSRKKMPELNFYSKMSKCKIVFKSILIHEQHHAPT